MVCRRLSQGLNLGSKYLAHMALEQMFRQGSSGRLGTYLRRPAMGSSGSW